MRYLGLDLGSTTLGISISDTTNTIASIYKTIRFKKDEYHIPLEQLGTIIKENNITKIVLGLPKNMNNTIGERGEKVLKFKEQLENKTNLKVYLEDERLTTKVAENILITADISRKKRKKVIDMLAAVLILQGYLDSKSKF